MLDIIVIVILIAGFFIGLKRGLVMQIVHLVGFIAAYIVAYLYFDDLAPHLKLWIPYPSIGNDSPMSTILSSISLEDVYYRAIAFALLFFGTKIILQIVGNMLNFIADLPLLRTVNRWLGGVLGFIEVYLILFLLLYVASLIPSGSIHTAYQDSFIGQGMVENTPVFSETIKDLWSKNMG